MIVSKMLTLVSISCTHWDDMSHWLEPFLALAHARAAGRVRLLRYNDCRPTERGRPLSWCPYSGSETGAHSRPHVRPGAVNLSAFNVPTSTHDTDQVCYSKVRAVQDEEAAGSNPATPTRSDVVRSVQGLSHPVIMDSHAADHQVLSFHHSGHQLVMACVADVCVRATSCGKLVACLASSLQFSAAGRHVSAVCPSGYPGPMPGPPGSMRGTSGPMSRCPAHGWGRGSASLSGLIRPRSILSRRFAGSS